MLVDDYSKRIFPHLVKSTEEWFETWRSFVARIEAELGTSTATDAQDVFVFSEAQVLATTPGLLEKRFPHLQEEYGTKVGEDSLRIIIDQK